MAGGRSSLAPSEDADLPGFFRSHRSAPASLTGWDTLRPPLSWESSIGRLTKSALTTPRSLTSENRMHL